MIDKSYVKTFSEKKQISLNSADGLTKDHFKGTEEVILFLLPEKSLVMSVVVNFEVAGNAGLKLKVKIGSTTVISAADVTTANTISKYTGNINTGTGKKVTVTPSIAVTQGEFNISVEYFEYTLSNKTLTNYNS